MENKTILIVDDEPDVLEILSRKLNKTYNIKTINSVDGAVKMLESEHFDLIITDLVMPQKDGLELLKAMSDDTKNIPVIVMSGNATLSMAVLAMQSGAMDFIEKPFENLTLITVKIEKVLESSANKMEVIRLQNIINDGFDVSDVIWQSLSIKKVIEKVKRIANVDTTVLITGETGAGKDMFASLIAKNSSRKDKRFVAVNCGSIPETLLESMLFGHKKGSFTSAVKDQIGFFEEANKGTIFLDEITETTASFQTKLLRVLENRTIRKLGDSYDVKIDVRVIAATNKDLADEVKKGNFREDLYYRLNVIQIKIPALRERIDDIEPLSEFFMKHFADKYKKQLYRITPQALAILLKQTWKGNIRELKNVIEHAVVMSMYDALLPEDLPAYLTLSKEEVVPEVQKNEYFEMPFAEAKDLFELNYIINILVKTNGDVTHAADISGIKRQFLYEKFKKFDLDPKAFRETGE